MTIWPVPNHVEHDKPVIGTAHTIVYVGRGRHFAGRELVRRGVGLMKPYVGDSAAHRSHAINVYFNAPRRAGPAHGHPVRLRWRSARKPK